jgi:neutral ceramidase
MHLWSNDTVKRIAFLAGMLLGLGLSHAPLSTAQDRSAAQTTKDSKASNGTKTAGDNEKFQVGFGKREITPPVGLPMWGYGARHDKPSVGVLDAMFAKAVVIRAGGVKLAIVGLDLGRGPTAPMMEQIRREIGEKAKIEYVMISGSHTHHGPVIELTDRPGFGKGKYDSAVAYAKKLPQLITEAILDADKNAKPARLGIAKRTDLHLNRNRHTEREPKVTDPMLAVMRFDDLSGKPIAILVNLAAHPVMTDPRILKYSADYPGFLQKKVEAELKTNCFFMEGAAGDMSPNPDGHDGPQKFGEYVGSLVSEMARTIKTAGPKKPSIKGKVDDFVFRSRTDFSNPIVGILYGRAFFPELGNVFLAELHSGVPAELTTVVLNGEIALVGGSGEFFCNHSRRLKERCYLPHTLFFGYCNGHSMYFPTIEAVSEGGYGADAPVSPVEVGAGEQMMDRALINIYTMTGKIRPAVLPRSAERRSDSSAK